MLFRSTPESVAALSDCEGASDGARRLRKSIAGSVENLLSSGIIGGTIQKGDKAVLCLEDGKFIFKTEQLLNSKS